LRQQGENADDFIADLDQARDVAAKYNGQSDLARESV
jgi:hypothetical protein